MKYYFSAPMPYNKEDINKLLEINNQIKKSRITSLYTSLPSTCNMFTGFEQSRNFVLEKSDWNYWKDLIRYVINKKCDFIYLLNKPCSINIDNYSCYNKLKRLEKLLSELNSLNVKKLRVASPQLSAYIGKHYKDFEVLASTSLEYKTIWEYQNFIYFHPEVKQIVPSHDINKNFKLLSILKKQYPKIEIEIMVNEGCLQGCPNRDLHERIKIDENLKNNNEYLSDTYCTSLCNKIIEKYPIQSLAIGTHIFPWEIKNYESIGIKNFKLVGRDGYLKNFKYYINSYTAYLKGIDNQNNIKDYILSDFTHHLNNNPILKQLTVKDYKKYLPKIEHFKKYGHLCASRCGVECRYCYKCAEKIQKVFEKKMKEKDKQPHYVPACKMA